MAKTRSDMGVGFTTFAAVMMVVLGAFDALQGLAAVIRKHYFVTTGDYVYKFNVTTWGWIHLVLGIIVALAGVALLRGVLWARIVGVAVAAVIAISNFMWLPIGCPHQAAVPAGPVRGRRALTQLRAGALRPRLRGTPGCCPRMHAPSTLLQRPPVGLPAVPAPSSWPALLVAATQSEVVAQDLRTATGGAASTSSWTRSGGSARASRRRPCRSRRASSAGRRSGRSASTTTPASRSESVSSTECSCSCSSVNDTASAGTTASESSIRSPNSLSPSSPSGVCREIGSRPYFCTSTTFSGRHVELLGELLRSGLAAEVLQHLALHAGELVDDLDHVHRDADRAGLVGHRAGDRLPDPPGRVRRELVALGVVELLDRTDQAEVALLDQVEEQHAAAGVALGQRDDQAQVGLEQVVLGAAAVLGDPLELALELGRRSCRRS